MPKFQVTSPEGHVLEIEAPEGATEQDAIAYAQQNYKPQEANRTADKPGYVQDVGNSILFRGIPEGVAASTTGGLGLNATHLIADATRAIGGKIYKAAKGEELPRYTPNPIPTSSDIINKMASALPDTVKTAIGATDRGLYEPRTIPGEYGNTIAQFGAGGLASGIPLNQSIPTAVVSETAGQLTKGTKYEPAARIGAAALTPLAISGGNYALNKLKPAPTPTSSDLKTLAQQSYKQADDAGGTLYPETINKAIDKAHAEIGLQTEVGKTFAGKNDVTDALESLNRVRDKHFSLRAAQEIDENLSERIDAHFDKINGYDKQGVKLLKIQQTLRDAYDDVSEANVPGGKAGLEAWKQGQKLWSASQKAKDIERILAKGEDAAVPATVYKNGFSALARTEMRGFTEAEKQAIRHAGKTGIVTGALKILGSRLMSGVAGTGAGTAAGFMGGGPVGSAIGAPLGLAAGEAAGYPMRAAANALQRGRGEAVLKEISKRPYVKAALKQSKPQAPIPQIPYQPNVPLLFGLGAGVRQ